MYVGSTIRRLVAHLSDELLGSIFWIPLLSSVWEQLIHQGEVQWAWQWILVCWIARVIYEVLCVYVLQALPSQYFLGLRILSTHHPELGLSLGQTVIRVLCGQLKYILGPAIYFVALFHRERQHLGDLLAETRVVQFQERLTPVRSRVLMGSLLVYGSLVSHLGQLVDKVSSHQITSEGVIFEWPTVEIEIHET